MKRFRSYLAIPLLATAVFADEKSVVLFDGSSLDHWTDSNGKPPGEGWVIEADGSLFRKEKAGDLLSKQEFASFELTWEWKIAEGGNSGLKYWVNRISGAQLGLEYQMIDDERHPDARKGGTRQTAAIYDIQAASEASSKPAGEWNQSKVICKGTKIEHWLNGKKVVEADASSDDWKERITRSKFMKFEGFAPGQGKLLLQDHNDPVWFRNIQIKVFTE